MSRPRIERPDLPEYMKWEELGQLPEEIARQIELWEGRVVWQRRWPAEYQAFTFALTLALKRCARARMAEQPQEHWRVDFGTDVFLSETGRSDFITPDFVAYHSLDAPYQDIRAKDVLLVGEVLSPSNTQTYMDDRQARCAGAGIPWYWEVTLEPEKSAIAIVRAFALETTPGDLPAGVHPLYPANYLLIGKWTPKDSAAIDFEFPFRIHIPWSDLEF